MRCQYCGANIPEGMMICPDCRMEVQMVPDYNPLDDVLAREVRGSVEGATRPIQSGDVRRYRSREARENEYATRVLPQGQYGSSTRVLSQGEMDRIRSEYARTLSPGRYAQGGGSTGNPRQYSGRIADSVNTGSYRTYAGSMRQNGGEIHRMSGSVRYSNGGSPRDYSESARQNSSEIRRETGGTYIGGENYRNPGQVRQTTGNVRGRTGNIRQNTGELRRDAEERRYQQSMRKKKAAKKRLKRFLITLFSILAVCGVTGFFLYQNSYAGILGKGQKAFQSGEYSAAEKYFNRAIQIDNKKADAYMALAKLYIQQKNLDEAERVFLTVIDSQPENAELYLSLIQFYEDTDQLEKISVLLDGCDSSVLSRVEDYVSEAPQFSLEEGTYPVVQQISLEADGDIYYTIDGSEPTASSTPYTEPILVDEGKTVIKAVTVNKKGIPSLVSSRTYTVELQVEGAPAVTPSTGQYTTPMQISIQVPEGYTAYYTMDGSAPSAASSLYTGPIDMPQGSTIFSAVLVSDAGKMTQITMRNYVLEYEQQ